MPRIRKKTSKRGTTHQRQKIKHKATETRKKRKRAAKGDIQWKSKDGKDLGIPNNFPYKDQILAEVAEQRRQAEEAKQLRKELKKAAKAGAQEEEDSEGEFDGVLALHSAGLASGSGASKSARAAGEVEEEEEIPILINPEWSSLQAVLEAADVVVEMLDARDPLVYRSNHVEGFVKEKEGRKILLVLSKIDTCPREAVSSWTAALRADHPTLPFRAASAFLPSEPLAVPAKGKGKARADDALGLDAILSTLEKWAGEKAGDEPLIVAVVGITNSGKSSFVNSLVRNAAVPVYQLASTQDGHSTTTYAQEIALEISGKKIRLVDTPGLSLINAAESEADVASHRARDILTRSKGRIDRLKDPQPVVQELVTRANREDLMLFYNLPAFADKDANAFLAGVARTHDLIKKGGVLDVTGAARVVLRDWTTGKFPRYTMPTSKAAVPPTDSVVSEQVLSALTPRKELRKSPGLVKLTAGNVESRRVNLEASWVVSEKSDDEAEEDDDGEEEAQVSGDDGDEDDQEESDDEDEEEDDDEDDEEEDEDEDDEPVQPTGKRKRGPAAIAGSPPKKRVAFASEPKNTRQARSAAGAKGVAVAASRKAQAAGVLKATSKPSADAKPSKSKPVASKPAKAAAAKSPKSVVSKPPAKAAVAKKAANAAPSKKTATVSKAGEDAYDFKSFF